MLTCTIYLFLANAFVTTIAVSGSTEEELVQIFQGLQKECKEYKEKLISLEDKILSQNEYILDQDKRIERLENIIKSQKSDLIPQRDSEQHDNQSLEKIVDERIKKVNICTVINNCAMITNENFDVL
ncbi:uncharacterized protein LOC132719002 [Ruditapes philippinarum]|uniref:uncharacterized protein LOC132719002 n=1 Tax=Ruditapes philippinarum TaxID=129788 RepID=UPI00295B09F1|nr:uncharacterized protein LOC132719002 [Ruditapes philippinarum]